MRSIPLRTSDRTSRATGISPTSRRREAEALAHVRHGRQQHGGRRRQRRIDRLHRHLLEIAVEKPEVRAVADHELPRTAAAGARVDLPAELAGTRDDQRAGGAVDLVAVRIADRLLERGAEWP